MIKNISNEDILRLKQPCKNRNLYLVNNRDSSVSINGVRIGTMKDAKFYLTKINRLDIRETKGFAGYYDKTK